MTAKPDLYRAVMLGVAGFATTVLLVHVDLVTAVAA